MWRYGRENENVETLATTKYSSESVESVTDDKKDNTKLGDILEITKLGDIVSKFPGPASSRESLFTQQYSYGRRVYRHVVRVQRSNTNSLFSWICGGDKDLMRAGLRIFLMKGWVDLHGRVGFDVTLRKYGRVFIRCRTTGVGAK